VASIAGRHAAAEDSAKHPVAAPLLHPQPQPQIHDNQEGMLADPLRTMRIADMRHSTVERHEEGPPACQMPWKI
jgi:hypothetical protein